MLKIKQFTLLKHLVGIFWKILLKIHFNILGMESLYMFVHMNKHTDKNLYKQQPTFLKSNF